MHPSVLAAWHSFSEPFEGRVTSIYVDVLGLCTTGVGNLIDPIHAALALPWKRPDGSLASEAEVRADWTRVKNDRDRLKKLHWKYAAAITTIRLTDQDIDDLVAKKLASNEAHITTWLPSFPTLPADAQLGFLSLAWAAGPGFNQKFPNFTRSALAGKWLECAVSGQLRASGPDGTPNPGVIPRNKANKLCFDNAANVVANQADPRVLHWPNKFQPGLVQPEDNQPEDSPPPAPLPSPAPIAPPLDPQALPVIRRGATGDHVRLLQERLALASKGQRIVVDGSFGPLTEKFVRDFQRQRGLTSDGVVGPRTWTRLLQGTVDEAANTRAANLLAARTMAALDLRPGIPDDPDEDTDPGSGPANA